MDANVGDDDDRVALDEFDLVLGFAGFWMGMSMILVVSNDSCLNKNRFHLALSQWI